MSLKLSVGLSRKIGQPDYGSLQSSCFVEFELDSGVLHQNPEAFHQEVQNAYGACSKAVHDELARQQSIAETTPSHQQPQNGQPRNGWGSNGWDRSG